MVRPIKFRVTRVKASLRLLYTRIITLFWRTIQQSAPFLRAGKIINLHPSLLPKYPGLNTHQKVVDNKDSQHGATVHFVDEGLDTGQIIGFSKFKVKEYEIHHLEAKVHEIEHKLLPLICSLIKNDEIKFIDKILTINGLEYSNGKEYIF